MIDEQSPASGHDYASNRWAIGAGSGDNEAKLITKLAPEWVRTSDPVIRSPARYRWTTAPALIHIGKYRVAGRNLNDILGLFHARYMYKFRLTWAKQAQGTMKWNKWWNMPLSGFKPATRSSEVIMLTLSALPFEIPKLNPWAPKTTLQKLKSRDPNSQLKNWNKTPKLHPTPWCYMHL